jgi:hypothetical protein
MIGKIVELETIAVHCPVYYLCVCQSVLIGRHQHRHLVLEDALVLGKFESNMQWTLSPVAYSFHVTTDETSGSRPAQFLEVEVSGFAVKAREEKQPLGAVTSVSAATWNGSWRRARKRQYL